MANEQNLAKPLPDTDNSQIQAERGRKGGLARTPKKKYAARLRELKKKGLTNETVKRLATMLEEPESWVLDIRLFIDSLKAQLKDKPIELAKLLNADINLLKAHHGEKHKIEGELNHNVRSIQVNIIVPQVSEESKNETKKEKET